MSPADDMVERVGDALAETVRKESGDERPISSWPAEYRENMRTLARAAIAAMMEPTEAMVLAGLQELPFGPSTPLAAANCYRAMIRAALTRADGSPDGRVG